MPKKIFSLLKDFLFLVVGYKSVNRPPWVKIS